MVSWSSPSVILRDDDVYGNLVFTLFGLYVWEVFQTSGFEWSLITRQRKFTWPLVIVFFLCRYCLLFALCGLIMSLSIRHPISCQALYTFNSWSGNMSILCASTSLMLRTIALWERKKKVVLPLGILCLAHWALLWRGMFVLKADYDPAQGACILTWSNHVFLNVSFFMTMGFDLAILLLTLTALIPHKSRSDLWTLLFRDGLVYFVIAFCFNALPAILNVMDLNVSMNVIATVPAATFSAIAACRSVIRLQEFTHADAYVHSASQVTPAGASRRYTGILPTGRRRSLLFARPEVHVTTDQFIMEDFVASPPSAVSNSSTKVNLQRTDTLEMDDKEFDDASKRGPYPVATAV